jgi:hypothetical protein
MCGGDPADARRRSIDAAITSRGEADAGSRMRCYE